MNLKGLILESRYAGYQFLVKGPQHKVWRDGYPVDEQKIIPLQFERYICMLDDMDREQEWDDADRESVSRMLDMLMANPSFNDMWVHVAAKPPAPWPTYDTTHPKQIHTIADSIGMAQEALSYELHGREGGPRPDVVKNLQGLTQNAPVAQPEETDEMVAV